MIQNQKGFALVMTMALLPLMIAGFFLVWGAIGFFQQDLAIKHACRQEGITGQNKTGPLLQKLLATNPEAKKLKIQLEEVDREIAFARTSNQAALAGLMIKRSVIQLKRVALDLKQKRLIQESNRELSRAHHRGRAEIRGRLQDTSSFFIAIQLKNLKGKPPRLAVRPDYSDIAPTYSPVPDFSHQQALAHEWHYTASVGAPFSNFLPGKFEFKKACAVTLQEDLSKWLPQIIKDNYSWRSVW